MHRYTQRCAFALALLVGSSGCASSVEIDAPRIVTVQVELTAASPEGCVTWFHLEGGAPFGEPLRVSGLRIEADEDIEHVEAWLSAEPIEASVGCPRAKEDDVVLYEGAPTADPIRYGNDGPTADVGMTMAVTADRGPCDNADCDESNLEVDVAVELLPL